MARYIASKLWAGETYYLQIDLHLQFTNDWDEKLIQELKATKNYPKSILSSYPPGFSNNNNEDANESSNAKAALKQRKKDQPHAMHTVARNI